MDRLDRIFRLHNVLHGRRTGVSREDLIARLECSRATLTRDLGFLRDYLGTPLVHDVDRGGYLYDSRGNTFELPGLWFSAEELTALVTIDELLKTAGDGVLGAALARFRSRIDHLLETKHLGSGEAPRRIRILRMASRGVPGKHFRTVAGAVLQRRRLHIRYYSRAQDACTEREVSPQRLTRYRDNWYLDAWCHLRKGLRSFAVECVREARMLDAPADDLAEQELDAHYASAYGIFSGQPTDTAVLRFTAERARWVADEQWHPHQKTAWLPDGRYELRVPYSDPRELVLDILRHGADVEVVAPEALRATVAGKLRGAADCYRER
jgi:predicted DNA-binding transcriptional regulator YafY